jgi:hypothetical protein
MLLPLHCLLRTGTFTLCTIPTYAIESCFDEQLASLFVCVPVQVTLGLDGFFF